MEQVWALRSTTEEEEVIDNVCVCVCVCRDLTPPEKEKGVTSR